MIRILAKFHPLMHKPLPVFMILASLIVQGCTTIANHFPGVYTLDIQQGNIIDQDMVDQLRPEMNKRQVVFIMGTPMLVDVFHPARWDYIYSNQPDGEPRVQKRLTLFFEDEKLVGVQGDFKPSRVPVIKGSNEVIVDVPKKETEKTLFEMIGSWFSSDTPEAATEQESLPVDPNDIDPLEDDNPANPD